MNNIFINDEREHVFRNINLNDDRVDDHPYYPDPASETTKTR